MPDPGASISPSRCSTACSRSSPSGWWAKHLKLLLKTECGSLTLDGIAFNVDRDIWPNPNVRWVELAYKLDVNEYQGRESVQLMVAHLAPR